MKKIVLFITLLSFTIAQSQIVNISDVNFKNALLSASSTVHIAKDINNDWITIDVNNDNEIQINEAERVIVLIINEKNINYLDGIEDFINIEILYCFSNNLTNLDLSNNLNLNYLDCYGNSLENLNLTQNNNLTGLYCSNNQLVNLDLSQNSNLTRLYCRHNQLSFLNIKNGNNNSLNTMMATNNPNLYCIQVDDENATYPNCDLDMFTGWCIDNNVIYNQNCVFLSVNNIEEYNFIIHPNPSSNLLNIKSKTEIAEIKIYNKFGQFVIKYTLENQINISNLTQGLYFVKVEDVNGNFGVKKIVKK